MRSLAQISEFITTEFLPDSDPMKLDPDLDLIETGIVDSLGFLRIISSIENAINVSIEPEELDPANFRTVRSISDLIERKFNVA